MRVRERERVCVCVCVYVCVCSCDVCDGRLPSILSDGRGSTLTLMVLLVTGYRSDRCDHMNCTDTVDTRQQYKACLAGVGQRLPDGEWRAERGAAM